MAILQASFRESDRAVAVGAWSALGGVAGAIGPFVGGILVDGPGWRWAFLINVPLSVVVLVCARTAVPESRDEHATGRLDGRGVALSVVGLACGTWALTEAGLRGWGDASVVVALVVAVLAMAGFVAHVRRAPNPLVSPQLFRNRTFTVVNLGTLLLYTGIGLTFFLVAYELQVAAGWSALEAGLALAADHLPHARALCPVGCASPNASDLASSSPSDRSSPAPGCCCSPVSTLERHG